MNEWIKEHSLVTKVFQLLLFLSPVAVGADINMDMFDIVFFRTGVIALFAASLLDTPKRIMPGYVNKIVFGLMALCMVNIFVHTFAPIVMHTQMNLFLAIVAMYVVYTYWDKNQGMRNIILGAALVNLVLFASQKAGFNPVFEQMPYVGQEGAFLGNQPRLMTYLALVAPFAVMPLAALGILLGIYTNQIIIFAPVAIMIFAKFRSWRARLIFCALTLSAVALLWDRIMASLLYRINVSWGPVLQNFFDRPLVGFGMGVRPIPEFEVIGNSYLQFIVGVGILGLVWFWYLFKNIYRKVGRDMESVALASLAAVMLVEYPVEIPRLWYLIIAIVVMFLLKKEERSDAVHDAKLA